MLVSIGRLNKPLPNAGNVVDIVDWLAKGPIWRILGVFKQTRAAEKEK